jgi:hypothetical protein
VLLLLTTPRRSPSAPRSFDASAASAQNIATIDEASAVVVASALEQPEQRSVQTLAAPTRSNAARRSAAPNAAVPHLCGSERRFAIASRTPSASQSSSITIDYNFKII